MMKPDNSHKREGNDGSLCNSSIIIKMQDIDNSKTQRCYLTKSLIYFKLL